MGLLDFFKKKKTDRNTGELRQTKEAYQITIPKEKLVGAEAKNEEGRFIGTFNIGALDMEHKPIFGWAIALSILPLVETVENEINEKVFIDMQDYCDHLSEVLKSNPQHPNSIFIGRVTKWPQMDCVWYVNNPELAHTALQNIIASKTNRFAFRYEINQDPDWKGAHRWLDRLVK